MTNSVTVLPVLQHKLNNDVSWSSDIPIGKLPQAILTPLRHMQDYHPSVAVFQLKYVWLPDMTLQGGTALSKLNDCGRGPTRS